MTAAPKRPDKITAEYVPPPPPAPGKIIIRAPLDKMGHPLFPDLHLTPEQTEELIDAGNDGIQEYLLAIDHVNG